jgi:hypothetical protein
MLPKFLWKPPAPTSGLKSQPNFEKVCTDTGTGRAQSGATCVFFRPSTVSLQFMSTLGLFFFLKGGRSWFLLIAFNDLSGYTASKFHRTVIFAVADEIYSKFSTLLVIKLVKNTYTILHSIFCLSIYLFMTY